MNPFAPSSLHDFAWDYVCSAILKHYLAKIYIEWSLLIWFGLTLQVGKFSSMFSDFLTALVPREIKFPSLL